MMSFLDTFSKAKYMSLIARICALSHDASIAKLPKWGAHIDQGLKISEVIGNKVLW